MEVVTKDIVELATLELQYVWCAIVDSPTQGEGTVNIGQGFTRDQSPEQIRLACGDRVTIKQIGWFMPPVINWEAV